MPSLLVVDDDPLNTKLLTILLGTAGYAVTAVHSAPEAIATLERTPYDLLLLDIMMPGMDGLALCRRIRQTSSVPIIFVSARGTVTDEQEAAAAGGDAYVRKPFVPDALLAQVEALLPRSQVRAAGASDIPVRG